MKTVLITGGSRGIGRAAVKRFAHGGYQVVFCYHSHKTEAAALLSELSDLPVAGVQADVSDPEAVKRLTNGLHVDVLVNNAGIAGQKLLCEITPEEWDRMFAVNVRGMYLCARAVLPNMIRRQNGKIINLSSIWGITGASCEAAYSASKAAVIGLTRALAKEVGPSGIQVNCVAPGVVDTEMNQNLTTDDLAALREETPLGRCGTAAEIADVIFYLASPGADFITGQVISPNGGLVI